MREEMVAVKRDVASQVDIAPGARRGRPRGRVRITLIDRWCKGCGLCTAFCPTGAVISDAENKPQLADVASCTACRWCVLHCPDFAIWIHEEDEPEPKR